MASAKKALPFKILGVFLTTVFLRKVDTLALYDTVMGQTAQFPQTILN